jgi:hypothetical protein
MGKPDRAGDLALVGSRRSSAALNDDFVDIGDFQQFSAYRIESGSTKRPRCQTSDMDAIQVQDAPRDGGARHQNYGSDGRGDDEFDDRMIGIDDLHGDLIVRPHQ